MQPSLQTGDVSFERSGCVGGHRASDERYFAVALWELSWAGAWHRLELLETVQISSTVRPEVHDPIRSGLFRTGFAERLSSARRKSFQFSQLLPRGDPTAENKAACKWALDAGGGGWFLPSWWAQGSRRVCLWLSFTSSLHPSLGLIVDARRTSRWSMDLICTCEYTWKRTRKLESRQRKTKKEPQRFKSESNCWGKVAQEVRCGVVCYTGWALQWISAITND